MHFGRISVLFLCVMLSLMIGCKKQKSTIVKPLPDKTVPVDTSFNESESFISIDTSDDVSFVQANLDAEFQRMVEENLKTILFDYNSYKLAQSTLEQLAVAGNFLTDNSTVRVLIEGHCDERGSSEYNMGLGENRARIVKDYLVNYGIESIRLEITSWGKEQPVEYGCDTDPCHDKNRRSEFKILSR